MPAPDIRSIGDDERTDVTAPPPPNLGDPALAADLRADLASYTSDVLDELLGPVAAAALAREQRIPARIALAESSEPLALLARLFLLGDELTGAEVERALPATTPARAEAAHLVTRSATGRFRAAVDISPTGIDPADGPAWIVSDLPETVLGHALPPWHVLGVGGASQTLHALLPQPPAGGSLGTVLDLGTGSGIQALTLARRAERVIATDLSERALAFLCANAALADIPDGVIEARAGSLFEPVAGETFDLIVSNPPFVITPAAAYDAGLPVMEYRDSGTGASGDELLARLIADLGTHLAPGGRAIILANWEVRANEDEFARPRAWVAAAEARAGVPLDSWIIRREFQDAAEYAEMWLRDGGLSDDYDALYRAYLADFAARGVRWVDFGYLLFTRPLSSERGVHETSDLTGHAAPDGETLWRLAAERARLERTSDSDLAASRITAADDVTLEHHFRIGESQPEVITATQGGGLHQVVSCPTEMAGLLSAADGSLTVGQIAAALAALLDVEGEAMAKACIAHTRRLASIGMLSVG
ncbi:Methyltransferase small domain-containing protein [Bowdeniella nasicola]|uniref:Methyltransferase small domain-containing protein n=1 Tax=Bowdeniella nasicola TaxID=208480 RepID=A0A1H3WY88_9ACTO|nr:methyltransferase [Bowdeniella nasicola]SDZ92106.1 Methyltransferase small domain-containing protein [Bowdeniella nasicola]